MSDGWKLIVIFSGVFGSLALAIALGHMFWHALHPDCEGHEKATESKGRPKLREEDSHAGTGE